MSSIRAATTLALWTAAWQGGQPSDDVLAAIDAVGHRAGVRAGSAAAAAASGLPGPGARSASTAELLPVLRNGGMPVLVMPVAGDLRGLPVGGDILLPALDAGAVVVLTGIGIALLAMDSQWRAFRCTAVHPAPSLELAQHQLDVAVAGATRLLTAADLAQESGEPRERIKSAMLAEAVDCPPGTDRSACQLLARVISLQAVLSVAADHRTAAVTSRELAVVDDALSPLAVAVRDGRRAAVAVAAASLARRNARSAR